MLLLTCYLHKFSVSLRLYNSLCLAISHTRFLLSVCCWPDLVVMVGVVGSSSVVRHSSMISLKRSKIDP